MERRGFLRNSALAGAAVLPGMSLFANTKANELQKTFNLNYGFHDGMFAAHAGKDFIEQIKFAHEQGFRSIEDNGMMDRTPEMQAKIGETLVEIHGQHDQHSLLNSKSHLTILDEFSDNSELLTKVKHSYQELKEIDEKIEQINRQKEQANREQDYLSHVIEELESI